MPIRRATFMSNVLLAAPSPCLTRRVRRGVFRAPGSRTRTALHRVTPARAAERSALPSGRIAPGA
ncbi:Hypothetical protein A7982_11313 [Minicystis rosea]|nr:Hypothetical protein A7982_11313 [Minicystis rosea]